MTITCLPILWATLVVASAQTPSSNQSSLESGAVIQNQNVNIILNVNAQEVAEELWKIIESRLNNRTNHTTSSKSVINDLKEAIIPLVSPSRRTSESPFDVANELDKITRRAITRDTPSINTLDEEIMTRDIVADMMVSLKMVLSKENDKQLTTDKKDNLSRRSIDRPVETTISDNNEQDDYRNVRIKIRRKDILNALY